MTEDERRIKLVDELASDPRYSNGRKSFPRTVTPDDALWIAEGLAREVDRGCSLRAEAAAKKKIVIACHRGCNGCCEELVLVSEPEALRVARWLSAPANHAIRDAFLAAYAGWRERVGDAPERLATLADATDQTLYDAAHVAQWRQRVMCAFNRDGDCSVYEVRPLACRNGHAVDTSERCSGANQGAPATRLQFVPLDEFIVRSSRLLRATGNALGKRGSRALCVAVYQLLTAPID